MSTIADTSQMPAVVSKSLNMHEYNLEASTYEYVNKTSINNTSTITLSTSGGELVEFIISTGFINLGKSYLQGYFESGGLTGVYPLQFANGITFINTVIVQDTATGSVLMQLNNANRASEYYMRREMRYDDIAARDCVLTSDSATTVDGYDGIHEGICLKTAANIRYDGSTKRASDFRVEPAYFIAQTISGGTPTVSGSLGTGFRYQFSDVFRHTFLGLDKDIYIPSELKISFTLSRASHSFINSVSGLSVATPTEPVTTSYLKNFQLMLSTPVNAAVRSKLMSEVQSGEGMKLLIESVLSTNNSLSTSDQTVVLRLQKGMGDTLKKVDFVPYNSATTGSNCQYYYDHSNSSTTAFGTKVATCYAQVNNKRWNVQDYTESKGDYWRQNREQFKDTGINSLVEFEQNWGFTINWATPESNLNKSTNLPSENFNDGLPLDSEKQIELINTMGISGTSVNWLTYAVITKHLIIKNNGLYLTN